MVDPLVQDIKKYNIIYIYIYIKFPTYFAQMIEESLILPHPTACTTPANNFDVRKG